MMTQTEPVSEQDELRETLSGCVITGTGVPQSRVRKQNMAAATAIGSLQPLNSKRVSSVSVV
jgi:hypothetical protein